MHIVYLQFVASRCSSWGDTSWWCHQSNKWTSCNWTGVESDRNKTKPMADICGTTETTSAEDVPGHSKALFHSPFAPWVSCMWPLCPQYPVNSPQDEVTGSKWRWLYAVHVCAIMVILYGFSIFNKFLSFFFHFIFVQLSPFLVSLYFLFLLCLLIFLFIKYNLFLMMNISVDCQFG